MADTKALRAHPVPITLLDETLEREETKYLVFDANVLCDLEDEFDGISGWAEQFGAADEAPDVDQLLAAVTATDDHPPDVEVAEPYLSMIVAVVNEVKQLRARVEGKKPQRMYSAIRKTLAIALGLEPADVGRRMVAAQMPRYAAAIGEAFSIANGMDPTEAAAAAAQVSVPAPPTVVVDQAAARDLAATTTGGTRGTTG